MEVVVVASDSDFGVSFEIPGAGLVVLVCGDSPGPLFDTSFKLTFSVLSLTGVAVVVGAGVVDELISGVVE